VVRALVIFVKPAVVVGVPNCSDVDLPFYLFEAIDQFDDHVPAAV
jgi:hypothetical protein